MDADRLILRLFLSSPGDVATERRVAREVMAALENGHLLRDKVRFEIVAWDDVDASPPLDAGNTPQESVNRYSGRPADCDLTIVILWGKVGTPLADDLVRSDGTLYASGTVWEYEDALAAHKPVFVYRRSTPPQIYLNDPDLETKRSQYHDVQQFFSTFGNADGSARAGYNQYSDPEEFGRLLRQHLEAFVDERLRAFAPVRTSPISPDDPQVTQILTLIDEVSRKNRDIDVREAEISRLRRENEELRRSAVARMLTAATQPDASDAAVSAADALATGDTGPAEDLLRQQEVDEATRIEPGDPTEVAGRRQAAQLARELAALAMGHDLRAALAAYQRAAGYEPDDPWPYFYMGDLHVRLGSVDAAMHSYRTGAARVEERLQSMPDDVEAQRDRSVGYSRIGDVLVAQGDLPAALVAFRAGLAIDEGLVAHDPANVRWQRDLSISQNKIGHVLSELGDKPGALAAYRKGLAIREVLAARDPTDTERQRDLSVSHSRIGNLLIAEGDPTGALAAFRSGLAISEELVARDPTDVLWLRDLSVSYAGIGDVLQALGDLPGALDAYRSGLTIDEALTMTDPAETEWQRDLALSHERIGDVLLEHGDPHGALSAFRKSSTICQALAAHDPANTQWQEDLHSTLKRIRELLVSQNRLPEALEAFRASVAVGEALTARDPGNGTWQRQVSFSLSRLGGLLADMGSGQDASAALRRGLAISEVLIARDPRNTTWLTDVVGFCAQLGTLADDQTVEVRRGFLERGRKILVTLEADGRLPPIWKGRIAWFELQLKSEAL